MSCFWIGSGHLARRFLAISDGFLFDLVVLFDLFPNLSELLGPQMHRSRGQALDDELLHTVVLHRVVADDFHDLPDQLVVGLLHDLSSMLDGLPLYLLPLA